MKNWEENEKEIKNLIDNFVTGEKLGKAKGKGTYQVLADFACFDIETTKINFNGKDMSIMYIWQFALGDEVVIGRHWWAFRDMIKYLNRKLRKEKVHLKVFVHNLGYEFTFMQSVLKFESWHAHSKHKTKIYNAICGNVEFRCSYLLSGKSLEDFTAGCEHEKLSGEDFDYAKQRFPWTPLTDEELAYCIHDVLGLREAIQRTFDTFMSNTLCIPWTLTGFVRQDLKALKPEKVSHKTVKSTKQMTLDEILALADKPVEEDVNRIIVPTFDAVKKLKKLARGGNCLAADHYRSALEKGETKNQILKNVYSIDVTSEYPALMCTRKFPVGKWETIENPNLKALTKATREHFAWFAEIAIQGLKLKNPEERIPYIDTNRERTLTKGAKIYEGRVLSADEAVLWVTDIDWHLITKMYDIQGVAVRHAHKCPYGMLPDAYRKYIIDMFFIKSFGHPKGNSSVHYDRSTAKVLINSISGSMGTDPLFPSTEIDEQGNLVKKSKDQDSYYQSGRWAWCSYAWYVWTTAWGRWLLQQVIDAAGDKAIYVDTDGVKMLPGVDLNELNQKLRDLAVEKGAIACEDSEIKYLGDLHIEYIANEFKVLGQKMYCYTKDQVHEFKESDIIWAKKELGWTDEDTKECDLYLTCSGVPSDRGAMELWKNGKVEAFLGGFKFNHIDRMYSYIVKNDFETVSWEDHDLELTDSIVIEAKRGFTVGDLLTPTIAEFIETEEQEVVLNEETEWF